MSMPKKNNVPDKKIVADYCVLLFAKSCVFLFTDYIHSSTVVRACADDGYHRSQAHRQNATIAESDGRAAHTLFFCCPKIRKLPVPRFCTGAFIPA